MPQGTLPFHYVEEKSSTGATGLSGLAAYLDMARVAGMSQSVGRHVRVRESGQGWTDAQMIGSLVMLNLAGPKSVDDPRSGRGGFCGYWRATRVWAGYWRCRKPIGRDVESARRSARDGPPRRAIGVCRRHQLCFGTWVSSTTTQSRTEDGLTQRSYPEPLRG